MNLQGIGFFVPHNQREERHGLMEMLAAPGGPARRATIFNAKFEMRAPHDSVELSEFVTALTKAGLMERPSNIAVEDAEPVAADPPIAPQPEDGTSEASPTARDAVQSLASSIEQLLDSGELHPRAARFFDRMLRHIGQAIDRGAPLHAAMGLTGFMAAVNRATERGLLSEESGAALTETARAAFNQLLDEFGSLANETNEAVGEVMATVQTLVEEGSLSEIKGIKLGNILDRISRIAAHGHTEHAADMLGRLAERIGRFAERGRLPAEVGEKLTAAIEEAIATLSADAPETTNTDLEATTQPAEPMQPIDGSSRTIEAGILVFLARVNLEVG